MTFIASGEDWSSTLQASAHLLPHLPRMMIWRCAVNGGFGVIEKRAMEVEA